MTDTYTAVDLRDALDEVLHRWLPTALAHVAHATGRPRPRYPRSWHHIASVDQLLNADQLPAIIVDVQLDSEERRAGKTHDLTWHASLTAVTRGDSFEDTLTTNDLYRTALHLAVLREPSLGGHVEEPVLVDETTVPDIGGQRTILAGWRRLSYTRRAALPDLAMWPAPPITEDDPTAEYQPPGVRAVTAADTTTTPRSD